MPHTSNHQNFLINRLYTLLQEGSGASVIGFSVKTLIREGGDDVIDEGQGANVKFYLDLKYKFGKWNDSLQKYTDIQDLQSHPIIGNELINDDNVITFGQQINEFEDVTPDDKESTLGFIRIPTVTEMYGYYGIEDVDDVELIGLEINKVICKGEFNATRLKVKFGLREINTNLTIDELLSFDGLEFPSQTQAFSLPPGASVDNKFTDTNTDDEYYKEAYSTTFQLGFTRKMDLPLSTQQLIGEMSQQGTNVLLQLEENLIIDDTLPPSLESSQTSTLFFNEEQISDDFQIPNHIIEQTLSSSYDAYSGIDLNTPNQTPFENTKSNLKYNQDGRVELGLFFFKEENLSSENFPIKFSDSIFNQISPTNLVKNGDCNSIDANYEFQNTGGDNKVSNIFKPAGGWRFLNFNGTAWKRKMVTLLESGLITSEQTAIISYLTTTSIGQLFTDGLLVNDIETSQGLYENNHQTYYVQDSAFQISDSPLGTYGYGGYLPYVNYTDGMLRNYYRLYKEDIFDRVIVQGEDLTIVDMEIDNVDMEIDNQSYELPPIKDLGTGPIGMDMSPPIIASWIRTTEAFSNDRCLVFNNKRQWNESRVRNFWNYYNETISYYGAINAAPFALPSNTGSLDIEPLDDVFLDNQYRVLNQSQLIYRQESNNLNPYSSLKVKFKMKTVISYSSTNKPQVEVGIYETDFASPDGDGYETEVINYSEGIYSKIVPENNGSFNSTNYYESSNISQQINDKFGNMIRVENTLENEWESFEFIFNLTDIQRGQSVIDKPVQDLIFFVQAGNNFLGRVLLDDFEVVESYEFFPDVDVRKKISVDNYGSADLTKYYDPIIHGVNGTNQYKDTTAPLEVQFYFYPTYPTDKIFDVKRTPMYEDFKKGLFYIYDVNWGDGSPNEFINEPVQIDENNALYHTYESNGIFEVTGFMMRLKPNKLGEPEGLIHNKKFSLRININEGLDEDFKYFSDSGFSFIPYKNTSPIIGGISKQSSYFKTLKRLLGFLDNGEKTNVSFNSKGDRLKTELALLKSENQLDSDLEILPAYLKERFINPITVIDADITPEYLATLPFPTNLDEFGFTPFQQNYLSLMNFWDDNGRPDIARFLDIFVDYTISNGIIDITDVFPVSISSNFEVENPYYEDSAVFDTYTYPQWITDYLHPVSYFINLESAIPPPPVYEMLNDLGVQYLSGDITIPASANSEESNSVDFYINPEILTQESEKIYNGITPIREELGKGIGDCDLTCVKYYNEPKSIWELFGFEQEDLEQIGNPNDDRYWKNIIPEDYSIFNREGLNGVIVDTYSEQEWFNNYYYPVLPKYGQNGEFIETMDEDGNYIPNTFPNNKTPFPKQGQVTDENESNNKLLINVVNETIDTNVLNDKSGNDNLGFIISDYKPKFNDKTLKPSKLRFFDRLLGKTKNGAF